MSDEVYLDDSLFDKYDERIKRFHKIEDSLCDLTAESLNESIKYIKENFSNEYEYIFALVCHISNIRPFSWKFLVHILSKLPNSETIYVKSGRFSEYLIRNKIISAKRPRIPMYTSMNLDLIEEEFERSTIPYLIRVDNIDKFIEESNKNDFDYTKEYQFRGNNISMADLAATFGSTKIFRYLLMNKATINDETAKKAVYGGNHEIVRLCQQNGCDLSHTFIVAIESHNNMILNWLCENYEIPNINFFEIQPKFNTDALLYLLKLGKIDLTPQEFTSLTFVSNSREDLVLFLLENGENVNDFDSIGLQPIHNACIAGNEKCAKILIENGRCELNKKCEGGMTALHFAVSSKSEKIVELIVKHGAMIDIESNDAKTPLNIAIENDSVDIAKILLENRAFVSRKMMKESKSNEIKNLIQNYLNDDDF